MKAKSIIAKSSLVVCFLGVLFAVYYYWLSPLVPYRTYVRMIHKQIEAGKDIYTPKEWRDIAHKMLANQPASRDAGQVAYIDHVSFIALMEHGDRTSIPLLVKALARQKQPGKDGIVIDTSMYCVWALNKAAHVDFGFDVAAWENWEKMQSNQVVDPTR